jgi:hypothetical protein
MGARWTRAKAPERPPDERGWRGLNLNSTFDSLATHEPLAAAPSLAPYGASLLVERSQAPTINVVNQLD